MLSVQLGHRELICVSINQGRPKGVEGGMRARVAGALKVLLRSPEPYVTLFYFGDWGKNSFP